MFDFSLEVDPGAVLFMMIAVFVISYGMLCRFGQPMKFVAAPVADKRKYSPVIAITVNLVLLVVYLLYCGIQVIYLFMRRGHCRRDILTAVTRTKAFFSWYLSV